MSHERDAGTGESGENEPFNPLRREHILAVFDNPPPVTSVSDTWYGRGYVLHLGSPATPRLLTVFPEVNGGGVVEIQSVHQRQQVGPITDVTRTADGLQLISAGGDECVMIVLGHDGTLSSSYGQAAIALAPHAWVVS